MGRTIERLTRAVRLARHNPALLAEMAGATLARPGAAAGRVRRCVGDVLMEFDCDLGPLVREMHAGRYEVAVVHRLRRLLREGDVFVDVGANVGYLSAVAAGCVGRSGEVHAFEPVPRYHGELANLAALNPGLTIRANAAAAGETKGTARIGISRGANTGWNTMVPGAMDADSETIEVPVVALDDYLGEHGLASRELVVKVDAEGFELPVLRGLRRRLAGAPRPRLLCEVSPDAYPLLGEDAGALERFVAEAGYRAHSVDTMQPVKIAALRRITDVVLLPA